MKENKIEFIDILHSDIQGAEVDMLLGATQALMNRKIHYICLSTHSDELHRDCLKIIQEHNFEILCEADLTHAMHVDGFLIARAKEMPGLGPLKVHKRQ